MRDALSDALGRVRDAYVEIRLRRRWTTTVVFRRRRPEVAAESDILGGVVRCLAAGAGWGAVAFNSVDRVAAAVQRARELSLELRPETAIDLAPIPIRQVEHVAPLDDDPRSVPLDDKRRFLDHLTGELLGVDRRVVDSRSSYTDTVHETWLATSEGTWLHELKAEAALGALAVASEDGATERAVDSVALSGGWTGIQARGGLFRTVAERTVQRLHSQPVRPGRYTVILDPRATGALTLQGIADLCRAAPRGQERDVLLPGTRIGPECLTVGDDPTAEGLRTILRLDDEGTPVANTMLVQHGVVVGHLHTRETAARDHAAPTGHALAPALRAVPGARPTNTYLAKGARDARGLVSECAEGLYLADVLVVGSEARRLTLVPGFARMIRRGELAESVKCPAISGDLYAIFGRLDAVAADFGWDESASQLHEGPVPSRFVTTGAPHSRFVDLDVSAMYA
jgi:TldD protein